jgi:hypothetical protein
MTQEHINIEAVISCLELDLEFYTIKFDCAEKGTRDYYYYMGLKKGISNSLSTIKNYLP